VEKPQDLEDHVGPEDPSDQWLYDLNRELRAAGVPPKDRPKMAWDRWAEETGWRVMISDPRVKRIFSWFAEHSKPGSQYLFDPTFRGVFFFDVCFWPVVIPMVFGEVTLNLYDSVKKMNRWMLGELNSDTDSSALYIAHWNDCYSYHKRRSGVIPNGDEWQFARDLFLSADQELTATVALLLLEPPNARALGSSRMAIEMFMKAYLALRGGLNEARAKDFGHDLTKLCKSATESGVSLSDLEGELAGIPDVRQRYRGDVGDRGQMWVNYRLAQQVATRIAEELTNPRSV